MRDFGLVSTGTREGGRVFVGLKLVVPFGD
jgi:hypothetical protein